MGFDCSAFRTTVGLAGLGGEILKNPHSDASASGVVLPPDLLLQKG
jgi:hypothetical protein